MVSLLHENEHDGAVVTLVNLDRDYPPEEDDPPMLRLDGHGYRWLRPRRFVFE